jgi:hypothetical protein
MKSRTLLCLPAVILGAPLSAPAATVVIAPTTPVVTVSDISGAFLPVGTSVRLGFFLNTDFVFLGCEQLPAFIANSFVPLGEATSPAGLGNPADNTLRIDGTTHTITGSITSIVYGNGTPNTLTPGSLSRGTRLFLIVEPLSGPDLGIFSADNWIVPASGDLNMPLRLTDINTPSEVFRGQLAFNGLNSTLIAGSLCPEPGPSLLTLLTAAALTTSRRRPDRIPHPL